MFVNFQFIHPSYSTSFSIHPLFVLCFSFVKHNSQLVLSICSASELSLCIPARKQEMLGNIDGARAVFERWMQWQPAKSAWVSYIGLETRHGNFDRARSVFERYLLCHATCESYLQYAAFEAKRASTEAARAIYERCAVELGEAEV
jgi:hypothetical protein